jgi:uncharacterized protein YkwD
MHPFVLPAAALLLIAASFGLAGCGPWLPSTALLSGTATATTESKPEGFLKVISNVALGPITGPPKLVSDRLVRVLNTASQRAELALMNYDGAEGDYRLEGDIQAVRQGSEIKVIYAWQVFDQKGARVEGASGTETVPGSGVDVWNGLPDPTLQVIAERGVAAVVRVLSKESNDQTDMSAQEALRWVNDYRKSKNLQPLTLDNDLSVAASALAVDMAKHDRFSHAGPNGADLGKRLAAAGYTFKLAAENVAVGQRSLTDLIDEWKKDPAQNRNMLLPDAKQMGIAYVYRPNTKLKTFWTLVVAARDDRK